MTLTVNESSVIPVTPGQVQAFTRWARAIYRNYATYKESIHSPVIDEYIYNYILTPEMKTVWRVSEPGNAVARYDALGVNRFKIYRARLKKKTRYMKEKLGKLAFREEYRETLRQARDARIIRVREIIMVEYRNPYGMLIQNHVFRGQPAFPAFAYKKNIKMVTEDFINKDMNDTCVICMEVHKMSDVCETRCGHQFGTKCLSSWNKPSCPLCRSFCTEVSEYKVAEIIDVM
jgi:hypothetical protein